MLPVGVQQLSASVFLYEPRRDSQVHQNAPHGALSSRGEQPKLVILATWLSAQSQHISKYVSGYQSLFPSTRILVIRSSPLDWLLWPKSIQQHRVGPAISTALSSCDQNDCDMILHIFSNGGCLQACNFLNSYIGKTSRHFKGYVTVFDSCPGRTSFKTAMLALRASAMPSNTVLRLLVLAMIYFTVSISWSLETLVLGPCGVISPIEQIMQDLTDPRLMDGERARCYAYSDTDHFVQSCDVEAHAQDAARKGFAVHMEKFEGTGHCAHSRGSGAGQYWSMVQGLWWSAPIKKQVLQSGLK